MYGGMVDDALIVLCAGNPLLNNLCEGKVDMVMLVRAECVRCPWLLTETKVATILGD